MSKRYKKGQHRGYNKKQKKIMLKTMGICIFCGLLIKHKKDFSQEHMQPKSRGGSNHMDNMWPAHIWCNEEKGCKTELENVLYWDNEHRKNREFMERFNEKQRG